MIHIEVILDKLKSIAEVDSNAKIARLLGIKPDALFQRQQRNSIPHDNVIKYCLENGISLDMLYENHNVKILEEPAHEIKTTQFTKNNILSIKVFDSNEYISIPYENTKNKKLSAYIDDFSKAIYIFDVEINSFETDGLYFISYNNRKSIKNLQTTFKGTISISEPSESSNHYEISENDINKIEFIGKVVSKIIF